VDATATSLYYTFSTIAQALAGALAVLVAFTLFRLAKLDEAIKDGRGGLIGYTHFSDRQKHWEALLADDAEGLEKSLGAPVPDAGMRMVFHEAFVAAGLRPRILGSLRIALGATATDIAICFIALPLIPILACRPIFVWGVGGGAVVLGIVCLWFYLRLITAMVYRPAD
jgi:hypothetical protein